MSFRDRYRRLGDLNDLEAALQKKQEAVGLTPDGHPDRADRLQGLARLGDLNDLEAALQKKQEALELTPDEHPDRADHLQNRYKRLGDLNDLEAALQLDQKAVELTPDGHPDRADRLQSLAVSFTDRYMRLGDLSDLEAALQRDQEAVDLTPDGHPDRAGRLEGLAISFTDRYQRLGDLNDLEVAIKKFQEAVDFTPDGHPDRAGYLNGLAMSFRYRYQRLGDLNDLEAALQRNQESVDLTPNGHPDRARHLQGLAVSFTNRYKRLGDLNDLEAALQRDQEGQVVCRVLLCPSWIDTRGWEFESPNCITAYFHAFNLLPEIFWIGNVLSVRHEVIHRLDIGQVTSTATKTCIDFSDTGLGITFQQMLQLRPDLHKLSPAQANELQILSSQLYSGTSPDPRGLAVKRQDLLQKIRQQPNLEYFLLPKPYKELWRASQGGPVIILNSHPDHCDGIIILDPTSESIHVPFPNVTLGMLKSQQESLRELLGRCNIRTREESTSTRLFSYQEKYRFRTPEDYFADLLAWLWTHIVAPVYQVLESHGITNGRLWWLPSGAFTRLPLHACAPTDEFICSYTATLGSLLDGYARRSSITPKVGVVGVTHTGHRWNYLPGVEQEVKNILSIVTKEQVECLDTEQATVDAVNLQLQNCSWIHLACHGTQDVVDPTKSRLLLYGGNLEMETILQMPLPNAEFVFLAACQTAMGDAKLVNESFHLGGGFIAAGFRGAIGTMWSMNDSDGPLVAEIFYSHLFREGRQPQASDAAEALHLAVKELKARKVPYERWIPFIHMGV
ncbi:CHAT domain-containing protein [Mycena pura]|uniref:CHAT domain-containing protein n=1 Tax=Mycena pura TaxID=153505 RepID=A0AAD6VD27_9AGAR|nr:CHAT domain-containing protein [Mycena pura]